LGDHDNQALQILLRKLETLQEEMRKLETTSLRDASAVHPTHRASARNLMHYLALRRHDIRLLQAQLAELGLSSLGRTEPHVISAVRAVITALNRLMGSEDKHMELEESEPRVGEGKLLLEKNTEALLGPAPEARSVRIMVTMPSEAATDYELVRDLVLHGMNCMRINCAHDGPEEWVAMVRHLRRAEKETGKQCKVEMDVAGPKVRTGPITPGPAVMKYRPHRDDLGRVVTPARIWLTPEKRPDAAPARADASLHVPGSWLKRLKRGERIRFTDSRRAKRSMVITSVEGESRWAEGRQTAYLTPGTTLAVRRGAKSRKNVLRSRVGKIPPKEQALRLHLADTLVLTRSLKPGRPARYDEKNELISPARIGVTLPEFFEAVRPGEPVWFDDGKIGGIIRAAGPDEARVQITQARASGEKLGGGKGINVPESNLRISCLTPQDLEVLKVIAEHADLVGYSFVRSAEDVRELQARLSEQGGEKLGIVLKIETRQGFEQLPSLLLAAMRSPAVGVMIARGDLAVECGYQRLAEVQEEILWVCEAAHMPVIWATQVLESLAKSGFPSRSEITDAAMGERAECVMLNKGPYVVAAVRILDDILRRMQAHQEKKRSMLRKLQLATSFHAA
jgi:pyruvate kinase